MSDEMHNGSRKFQNLSLMHKGGHSMKVLKVVLLMLFFCGAMVVFADTDLVYETFSSSSLSRWMPVSGNWKVMNGRLVQTDTKETMAMITIPVRQYGKMLYQFDLRYVDGGQDDYAGFGIHICVNNPSTVRSWGNGQSLLAWVTWDPGHYGLPGAFLQAYESKSLTDMGLWDRLYPSSDIMRYGGMYYLKDEYLKYEYLNYTVPVKLEIDTRTGKGKFYDPFDPDRYYYPFDLGGPIRSGNYFTFRTNSVSVSVDNLKVTRLD